MIGFVEAIIIPIVAVLLLVFTERISRDIKD